MPSQLQAPKWLEAFIFLQGSLVVLLLAVGWAWSAVMRRNERLRRCGLGQVPHEFGTGAKIHGPSSSADHRGSGAPGTNSNGNRLAPHNRFEPEVASSASCSSTLGSVLHRGRSNQALTDNGSSWGPGSTGMAGMATGSANSLVAESSSAAGVATGALPGVTVILPVKGCRSHSLSNWNSHICMDYGGPVEFVFVVDSEQDPAWPALQQLFKQHPGVHARVHVAGEASTCSQKIHNLVSGTHAASPSSCYLLFLDDDVELHPGALSELVGCMEADPSLFMATGYPFDIPPRGSALTTYCTLVYHIPLLIAFSIKQRTSFVWGGCMLLRAGKLRPVDQHGILKAWAAGGYSDDLILAAQCTEQKLPIAVPSFSIYPQWLDRQYSWGQYWNYLRRQLYVLDTYSNRHNRLLNHTMMWVHSWASLAFAAPVLLALWRLAGVVLQLTKALAHGSATAAGSSALHSPRIASTTGGSSGWEAVGRREGIAAQGRGSGWLSGLQLHSLLAEEWSLCVFCAAALVSHCCLRWMTAEVLLLLRMLGPGRPPITPAHFSWTKLWAALLVENLLIPFCMAYTAYSPYIVWSGVRYCKQGGKVVRAKTAP